MKRENMMEGDSTPHNSSEDEPQKKRPTVEERANLLSKDLAFSELRELVRQELSQLDDNDVVGLILQVLPDQVTRIYDSLIAEERPREVKNTCSHLNLAPRSKEDKIVEILNKLDLGQLQNLASNLYQHTRPTHGSFMK